MIIAFFHLYELSNPKDIFKAFLKLVNWNVLKFFFNNSKESNIASTSPAFKSVLYVLSDNINNPLSFDELVKRAGKNLKGDMKATIEKELIANAMSLVIKGYMDLSIEPGNRDKIDLKKPKVSDLAMYQATKTGSSWVTNTLHMIIPINIFDKFVMQYMDGTRDKEQIISCLLEDIKNGKITLNQDDKKIEDEKYIAKELIGFYDNLIERFRDQALFV